MADGVSNPPQFKLSGSFWPIIQAVGVAGIAVAALIAVPTFWGKTLPHMAAGFVENAGKGTYTVIETGLEQVPLGVKAADIGAQILENKSVSIADTIRTFGDRVGRLLTTARNALVGLFGYEAQPLVVSAPPPHPPTPAASEGRGKDSEGTALPSPPPTPSPFPSSPSLPVPFIPSREIIVTRQVVNEVKKITEVMQVVKEETRPADLSSVDRQLEILRTNLTVIDNRQSALEGNVSGLSRTVTILPSTITPVGPTLGAKEITSSLDTFAINLSQMRIGPSFTLSTNALSTAGATSDLTLTPGRNLILSQGNLGIGTTSPGTLFAVQGDATITGNTTLIGAPTFYGALTLPSFSATSTSATSTVATGGFTVGADQFVVQQTSGNVGIGTTSPAALFAVAGESVLTGRITATLVPATVHTFSTWAIGAAGAFATSASVVINPASAAADTNIFGIAVAGAARFIVDAEGDAFVNSLTSVGAQTLSSTTASSFLVENATTLGDAIGDTLTINAGTVIYGNRATSTIVNGAANAWSVATSTTNVPILSLSTAANTPGGRGAIGILTASPSGKFDVGGGNLVVDPNGNVGIASTSPSGRLSIRGGGTGAGFLLYAEDSAGTNRLALLDNGNLGIGTTSPAESLSIGGRVLIGGTGTSTIENNLQIRGTLQTGTGAAFFGGAITATSTLTLFATSTHSGLVNGLGLAGAPSYTFSGDLNTGIWSQAADTLNVSTAGTERVRVDASGNVGIGTTSPWRTFSVAGTVGFNSSLTQSSTGDYLCINTSSFEVSRGNGVACSTSSQRFKDNIQGISYGLSAVVNLHPVSFTYKPGMNVGTSTHLGFIAEEMALTIPELVNRDAQGLPSGIDYPTLTAVLAKAVQELDAKVENIKVEILRSAQNDGGRNGLTFTGVLEELKNIGVWVHDGMVEATKFLGREIEVKRAKFDEFQMTDKATGEPYCIWLEMGEFKKVKGTCKALQATPSPTPAPSSTPEPSQTPLESSVATSTTATTTTP